MDTAIENEYLGKEKLGKLMAKFALPCIASLLVSSSYNIVDQIFIGNSYLGTYGNAATGVVFPLMMIALAVAFLFGDGASAFLALCLGKKENDKIHYAVGGSIISTIVASVILIMVMLLAKDPLLKLFGASENTIGYASEYYVVVVSSFTIYMLMNLFVPIIRSEGSPTFSMIAMLCGAVTNAILNPVFLYCCNGGMQLVAAATVIGQSVTFILCVVYLFKPKTFRLCRKSFVLNPTIMKQVISLGLLSLFTQLSSVVVSLTSNVLITKFGPNSVYGADIPIAAMAAQSKIYVIMIDVVIGVVLGSQPIVGYNMGANRYDRVKKLYRMMLAVVTGFTAAFTAIDLIYPDLFIGIFGGTSNALYMQYARLCFRLFFGSTVLTAYVKLTSIFFQSCGFAFKAALFNLVRDFLIFPFSLIALSHLGEFVIAPGSGIEVLLWSPIIADVTVSVWCAVSTVNFFKKWKTAPAEAN